MLGSFLHRSFTFSLRKIKQTHMTTRGKHKKADIKRYSLPTYEAPRWLCIWMRERYEWSALSLSLTSEVNQSVHLSDGIRQPPPPSSKLTPLDSYVILANQRAAEVNSLVGDFADYVRNIVWKGVEKRVFSLPFMNFIFTYGFYLFKNSVGKYAGIKLIWNWSLTLSKLQRLIELHSSILCYKIVFLIIFRDYPRE